MEEKKYVLDYVDASHTEQCYLNRTGTNGMNYGYTLSIIGGKWKAIIIYCINFNGTIRYNEIRKKIGNITHKMLSQLLKELEEEQVILRKEYLEVPPRVEYSLTDKGRSLIPIMNVLCDWGMDHKPKGWGEA